jgi:hypothetical protein
MCHGNYKMGFGLVTGFIGCEYRYNWVSLDPLSLTTDNWVSRNWVSYNYNWLSQLSHNSNWASSGLSHEG